MEVTIEDYIKEASIDSALPFLEHYGIKGMQWGVRRKRGSDGRVSTDAKRVGKIQEKRKSGGNRSLTNKELTDLSKRLELERKVTAFDPKKNSKIKSGHNFVRDALAIGATANAAIAFAKSPAGKKVGAMFAQAAKNAASGKTGSRPKRVEQLALGMG